MGKGAAVAAFEMALRGVLSGNHEGVKEYEAMKGKAVWGVRLAPL